MYCRSAYLPNVGTISAVRSNLGSTPNVPAAVPSITMLFICISPFGSLISHLDQVNNPFKCTVELKESVRRNWWNASFAVSRLTV